MLTHTGEEVERVIQIIRIEPANAIVYREGHRWISWRQWFAAEWAVFIPRQTTHMAYWLGEEAELFPLDVVAIERVALCEHAWPTH